MLWERLGLLGLAAIVSAGVAALAARGVGGDQPCATVDPGAGPRAEEKSRDVALAGIVRDFEGRPVEGATVLAATTRWERDGDRPRSRILDRRQVRTGADGRFAFTVKGDTASDLNACAIAWKAGFAPGGLLLMPNLAPAPEVVAAPGGAMFKARSDTRIRRPSDAAKPDALELVLERPVPFVGIVRDPDGRPVAEARVRVGGVRREEPDGTATDLMIPGPDELLKGTPAEGMRFAVSDNEGRIQLPAQPAGARLLLMIEAEGMATLRTRDYGEPRPLFEGYLAGTPEAPAEIVMQPEARVVGRVRTMLPGVSVAGLKVYIQPTNDSKQYGEGGAVTDAQGRFTIRGLGEGKGNVFLTDHAAAGPWTYRAAADIELRPGETTEVGFELIEGVLVEGTVRDEDGKPVAEAHVGVYGPMRPQSGAAIIGDTTDRAGRYRFRLPPGPTYIYVSGPPPGYLWLPDDGSSQVVDLPEEARTFTVPPIALAKQPAPEGRPGR
jgi:protocatechuate 3,4-dioxygenase beta subunit